MESEEEHTEPRKELSPWIEEGGVFAISLGFALWVSFLRFAAGDEGFYLLAAKLVSVGKIPYLDFLYPQAPYYPYVLNGWFSVFGESWTAGRGLAALIIAFLSTLLFASLRIKVARWIAYGAVVVFLASEATLGWFSTVKPYGVCALLLFAAYFFIREQEGKRAAAIHFLLAGIVIAFSVHIRLYLVIVLPLFFLFGVRRSSLTSSRNNGLSLIFGFCFGSLPALFLWGFDVQSAWFNNVGFHLLRSELSFQASIEQKLTVIKALFGVTEHVQLARYQYAILLGFSVFYGLLSAAKRKLPDGAFWLAGGLFLVSIYPTPTWFQYYSLCFPFLVVCSALVLQDISELSAGRFSLGWYLSLLYGTAVVLLFAVSVPRTILRYGETGKGVPTVYFEALPSFTLDGVREVSARINELTAPGDVVFSRWPGFLLESHAKPLPGSENQFWPRVSDELSIEDRRRFGVLSKEDLRAAVAEKQVKLIVIRKRFQKRLLPVKLLESSGYEFLEELHGVRVYGLASPEAGES